MKFDMYVKNWVKIIREYKAKGKSQWRMQGPKEEQRIRKLTKLEIYIICLNLVRIQLSLTCP